MEEIDNEARGKRELRQLTDRGAVGMGGNEIRCLRGEAIDDAIDSPR